MRDRNGVKGIHRNRKVLRDGSRVEYHYAWRGGPRFWTSHSDVPRDGAEYWAAFHRVVQHHKPSRGKFREVITDYLKSPEFTALAARSQADIRRSIFGKSGIDAEFGDAPMAAFDKHAIRRETYAWRDGFTSARTADMRVAHLSSLVTRAVDRGYITQHHLRGSRKRYSVDRSEIIWTDAEIDLFVEKAPPWIGRILLAASETGLRPGDLAILGWQHVQPMASGRQIVMRTAKRRRVVQIPVTRRMGELIDATPPEQPVFLVGSRGKPLEDSGRLGRKVGEQIKAINAEAEAHGQPAP